CDPMLASTRAAVMTPHYGGAPRQDCDNNAETWRQRGHFRGPAFRSRRRRRRDRVCAMSIERIGGLVRQLREAAPPHAEGWGWPSWSALALVVLVLVPVLCRIAVVWADEPPPHWSNARWDSTGLAPDPATTPEPVIQFYAARTWGWRGVLGVHSWVVV